MTKQKKKHKKQQQNKKTNLWIYEVLTARMAAVRESAIVTWLRTKAEMI